jgi:hypothetical protein
MSSRREVIEPDDGSTTLEISEVHTWRTVATQAAYTSRLYGGITAGAAALIAFILALGSTGKNSLDRSWELFSESLRQAPTLLLICLPAILLVAAVGFGVGLWRRWALGTRYRISADNGELHCREIDLFGERTAFRAPAEAIVEIQRTTVGDSTLDATLDDTHSHEVTVISADKLYTFGTGLDAREADRVVERLKTSLFGPRHR